MSSSEDLAARMAEERIAKIKHRLLQRLYIRRNPVDFAEKRFPYKYWDMQRKIITSAIQNKYTTVKSCHGSGKMTVNGTPVLTPTGWVVIESLKIGDKVIAGNGQSTVVVGVYPHHDEKLYRVNFHDGTFLDVGGPHLWTIKDRQGRDSNGKYPFKYGGVIHTSPWKTKTTKEIFDFYQTIDKSNRHLNYELPPQPVVKLRKHKIPLDPYALGLLIGDGGMTTHSVIFSTMDVELLKALPVTTRRGKTANYGITGVIAPLQALGLLGKKSEHKFVPEKYKFNYTKVRLGILQGLMDTDGGISGQGIEFTSVSKQLAEDVQFLVRSLGGYTSINSRIPSFIYKGEKRRGQRSYRVYIRMDKICPFRLTRKAEQWKALVKDRKTHNARLIESVELLPDKDEATCISISNPDGLYITKDFIITHNSFLAGTTVLLFMEAFVPSKCLTTAPTNNQVENVLWAEIRTQFGKANPPYPPHWRPLTKELKVNDDHFAIGFATDDELNLQGIHGDSFLIVVDEAAGVSLDLFNALTTLMTADNSKMLLIGNPDKLSGYFYHSHESKDFVKFTISAFDTPNFTAFDITMDDIRDGSWEEKVGNSPMPFPALATPAWAAKSLVDYGGESAPLFVAKVFGEFPTSAIDSLIPLMYITQAQKRTGNKQGSRQWGLDVARQGTDSSVLRYRRGDRLEITQTFHKFDLTELVEWAAFIIRRVDETAPIAVDAVGLGAGVADMLKTQQHLNVFEYQGNSASTDEDCKNQRSEFYWHLRKLFTTGKIAGNIDEYTKEELCAMQYKIEGGKIRVVKKAEIKKKINRSPDHADALMLTYAPIGSMGSENDLIIADSDGKDTSSEQENYEMGFVSLGDYPL